MPEIVGHFPLDEDPSRQEPCVLCLAPTSTRAAAPGMGEGVEVPLHIGCAAWIVAAYGRRGFLSTSSVVRLADYAERVRLLTAGPAKAEG